ncbi:MAG TPA: 2-oxo acid dehydrogenase subunit E2, partial [Candidatus Eisenbacteria bacterium]|nr:2-oxo acid dehydrogenase subunit E2 [Candidatus Eisenbacteria bacterium]
MAVDLRLPRLGDVMTEGRLLAWLEPDGAEVRPGQPLYELETEKVSFTVEAPAAGVLRQVVPAGEVVEVGTVVGRLLEAAHASEVLATPAARRLARELGVDLAALGTGHRIRENDVRAYHAATAPLAAAPVPAVAEFVPYRGRRRTIGERMVRSQRTVAALTLTSEVRVDAALDLVDRLNREWRDDGIVLTLTRVVVRACALALREHPVLNGRLLEDRIELPRTIDVGIAVDEEAGLVVPVLRRADSLTLAETARAVRELRRRAEAGGLTRDDLEGATFTVTSLTS